MNSEERKAAARVMAHPGPWQYRLRGSDKWKDFYETDNDPFPVWQWHDCDYRIKPLTLEEFNAMPWEEDEAKWRAVDKNGEIYEYSEKPRLCAIGWEGDHIEVYEGARPIAFDWKDSLQYRESEKQFGVGSERTGTPEKQAVRQWRDEGKIEHGWSDKEIDWLLSMPGVK